MAAVQLDLVDRYGFDRGMAAPAQVHPEDFGDDSVGFGDDGFDYCCLVCAQSLVLKRFQHLRYQRYLGYLLAQDYCRRRFLNCSKCISFLNSDWATTLGESGNCC